MDFLPFHPARRRGFDGAMDDETAAMELEERCARFFQYSAAHAWDALGHMCAEGVVFAQNGHETDLDGVMRTLHGMTRSGIEYSYENARRTVAPADRRVVEQHHVTMRRGDGVEAGADVCVVLQFDEHGAITRVDEYADTAAFTPLLH